MIAPYNPWFLANAFTRLSHEKKQQLRATAEAEQLSIVEVMARALKPIDRRSFRRTP